MDLGSWLLVGFVLYVCVAVTVPAILLPFRNKLEKFNEAPLVRADVAWMSLMWLPLVVALILIGIPILICKKMYKGWE